MGAIQSPKIENDKITWYEGDCFRVRFEITDDATGLPYEVGEGESLQMCVRVGMGCVKSIALVKANDFYECCIGEDVSASLAAGGKYCYTIKHITADTKRTIYHGEIEILGGI